MAAALLPISSFKEPRLDEPSAIRLEEDSRLKFDGKSALVTRVGDALQEPFWPEGLGINRGLSALLRLCDRPLNPHI